MNSVVVLLFCVSLAAAAVWEYGDSRLGTLIWSDSGFITLLEKHKEIYVHVPHCQRLVYVKLEVDNPITTPEVNFDKVTNTLHIRYKLWQISQSTYKAYAKSVPIPNCYLNRPANILKD